MAFVSSKVFETEEQESARLAQAPEGSTSHALSTLPVKIKQPLQDLVIQLPWTRTGPQDYIIVVVPIEHAAVGKRDQQPPIRIHEGGWDCAVVYSTHNSYPVGGHRLYISTAELVRGALLNIQHVTYPGGQV